LRQALGLVIVHDFMSRYRFQKCLDDQSIDRAVVETVCRLPGTRRKGRRRAHVRVNATALSQGAVTRLCSALASLRAKTAAIWLKWLAVDLHQQFPVVTNRATRPMERLGQFAIGRRSGVPANAHRAGTGDPEFEFISVKS
jgi:hypothetical protein